MSFQRLLPSLLAVLTLGGALYLSAQSGSGEQDAVSPAVKRVRVAAVETADTARELRFSGITRSAQRARLGFLTSGRIIARPVEIGDRVRAGQELARLDDLELRNARDTAAATAAELTARRAQTERDLARVRQLAEAKAATGEELEQAEAASDALRAAEEAAASRLREAQRRLSETRLLAPFDATVTEILRETDEHAPAGVPILVLSGDGEVELEVEVPESVIVALEPGAAVQVRVPALDREIAGRIRSVGRTAAGMGRLFPVVVALASDRPLVAGLSAELALKLPAEGFLALPVEAVVNPGGRRPAVLKVADGRVRKVAVEVGALAGERVSVRGALQPGDRVVVGGQRGLLDGETVEIDETAEVEP